MPMKRALDGFLKGRHSKIKTPSFAIIYFLIIRNDGLPFRFLIVFDIYLKPGSPSTFSMLSASPNSI